MSAAQEAGRQEAVEAVSRAASRSLGPARVDLSGTLHIMESRKVCHTLICLAFPSKSAAEGCKLLPECSFCNLRSFPEREGQLEACGAGVTIMLRFLLLGTENLDGTLLPVARQFAALRVQ